MATSGVGAGAGDGATTADSIAFSHLACRENLSVLYQRMPRLFEILALAHGDGRYARLMRGFSSWTTGDQSRSTQSSAATCLTRRYAHAT